MHEPLSRDEIEALLKDFKKSLLENSDPSRERQLELLLEKYRSERLAEVATNNSCEVISLFQD